MHGLWFTSLTQVTQDKFILECGNLKLALNRYTMAPSCPRILYYLSNYQYNCIIFPEAGGDGGQEKHKKMLQITADSLINQADVWLQK